MDERHNNPDCAIIGAGVVGLSIAHELLSHGLSVTLIDRQRPGREASWAGAGMLPPGSSFSDHPSLEELARISRPLQAELSDRIRDRTGIDDGYWRCGGIYLATNAAESGSLDAMVERWRGLGIRTDPAHACTIQELLSNASAELTNLAERFSAYRVPDETQIRNPRLIKGLGQLCTTAGAQLLPDTSVMQIEEEPSGMRLWTEKGDSLITQRVVVATGAWSTPLLESYTSVRVKPIRGQMALFENATDSPVLTTHLHVGHYYLTPRRDGRMIAGSTVEDAGFDKSTTAEGLAGIMRFVKQTGLGHLRLAQTWAGLRPASSDGMPLIGPANGSGRVYFATGHFRSGLQFAPATAVLIREMMLGQPLSMDVTPFRVDR